MQTTLLSTVGRESLLQDVKIRAAATEKNKKIFFMTINFINKLNSSHVVVLLKMHKKLFLLHTQEHIRILFASLQKN